MLQFAEADHRLAHAEDMATISRGYTQSLQPCSAYCCCETFCTSLTVLVAAVCLVSSAHPVL